MWNQSPDNELPPELDDGEMWLPSDIFLNEVATSRRLRNHRSEDYPIFPCMNVESLSNHISSLSLLRQSPFQRYTRPGEARHSESGRQRFESQILRSASSVMPLPVLRSIHGGFEAGQRVYECKSYPSMRVAEPVHEFQLPKSIQPEVETYIHLARIKALQRQQNRLPNRVQPVHRHAGFSMPSSSRGSSGTGVFHPRNTSSVAINSPISKFAPVKRQVARDGQQELRATLQMSPGRKRVGLNRREDCFYHLPPDFGIP